MKLKNIRIKELLKFLVGGGSAVIVDYVTYTFLLQMGCGVALAKLVSYVSGATVGFVINKLWTFESKGFKREEIVKYVILYICSAIVNTFVNKIVLLLLPTKIIGFLCATTVSTVINFLGQKFFVFTKKEIE